MLWRIGVALRQLWRRLLAKKAVVLSTVLAAVFTGFFSDAGSLAYKAVMAQVEMSFDGCVSADRVPMSNEVYQVGLAGPQTEADRKTREWLSVLLQQHGGVNVIPLCNRISSNNIGNSEEEVERKAAEVVGQSGLDAILLYKDLGSRMQLTFAHRVEVGDGRIGIGKLRANVIASNDGNGEEVRSYIYESIQISTVSVLFYPSTYTWHHLEKVMKMLDSGGLSVVQRKNYGGLLISVIADAASQATAVLRVEGLSVRVKQDTRALTQIRNVAARLRVHLDEEWALASGKTDELVCWLAFHRAILPHLMDQIDGRKGGGGLFSVIRSLPASCASPRDVAMVVNNVAMRTVRENFAKLIFDPAYSMQEAWAVLNDLTEVAARFDFRPMENGGAAMEDLADAYALQMLAVLESLESRQPGITPASSWTTVADMLRHNLSRPYLMTEARKVVPVTGRADAELSQAAEQMRQHMARVYYHAALAIALHRGSPDGSARFSALDAIGKGIDEGTRLQGDTLPTVFGKKNKMTIQDILSAQGQMAAQFLKRVRMQYLLECGQGQMEHLCRLEAAATVCRYTDGSVSCR